MRLTLEPSPELGRPTTVVDRGKLGLALGFGREYAVDIDGSRFLWHKSESIDTDTDGAGIVVVENWAREFIAQ